MYASSLFLTRRAFPFVVTAFFALAALLGCGGDRKTPTEPGGGNGGQTKYTTLHGVFAGPSDGGRMSLSIATGSLSSPISGDVSVPVTGTMAPTGGTTAILGGVYFPATDTLLVGGDGFAVVGVYEPLDPFPSIAGIYQGPAGFGTFGCAVGESTAVKIFICTFTATGEPLTGRFNLAAVDTVIAGVAFPEGGANDDYLFVKGTVGRDGDPRAIVLHGDDGQNVLDATGEWNPNTSEVGGTWTVVDTSVPETHTGTWAGMLLP